MEIIVVALGCKQQFGYHYLYCLMLLVLPSHLAAAKHNAGKGSIKIAEHI